mmetsp:Transcript_23329/g.43849  ORF Transcript_23329/g.43849 Transcript_23329/m.43849 type:complete len:789 (+) Transcript_23329:368-2734(+)|eukprot:CAMPEP_0182492768 /NCGR_PEP_ID=MMETSP1321-20130603/1845_1 /TAXON_ID=91990 /ORGANISM="Bolidomonas sp., Strain RCC1657" /LENGTH=788 /DNA_ID=CAMNT_0024695353 /DNA_START=317 /DNA_END=2683 /DNA_ORIENTATION=+
MSAPSPPPGFTTTKTLPTLPNPPENDALGNINRTTSFANLAAVVGEGLAESMDDTFMESAYVRKVQQTLQTTDANPNRNRQNKHNSSRLIGNHNADFGLDLQIPPHGTGSTLFGNFNKEELGNVAQLGAEQPSFMGVHVQEHGSGGIHSLLQEEPRFHGLFERSPSEDSLPKGLQPPPTTHGHVVYDIYSNSSYSNPSSASSSPPSLNEMVLEAVPKRNKQKDKNHQDMSTIISEVFSLPSSPPCWQQLAPFIKLPRSSSPPTSGLVLLGVSSLTSKVVRTACEKFGSLNAMRGDFMQSRGLAFVSFLDERSAKKAASGLKQELGRCNSERDFHVFYCTPLHFSGRQDESSILLENLPDDVEEEDILRTMTSYGDVKKVNEQVNNAESDRISYLVKFYDLQDSKQAQLELSSSHPWGPGVKISFCPRSIGERKSGKKLLELIALWRHGPNANLGSSAEPSADTDKDQSSSENSSQMSSDPSRATISGLSGDNSNKTKSSSSSSGMRSGGYYMPNQSHPNQPNAHNPYPYPPASGGYYGHPGPYNPHDPHFQPPLPHSHPHAGGHQAHYMYTPNGYVLVPPPHMQHHGFGGSQSSSPSQYEGSHAGSPRHGGSGGSGNNSNASGKSQGDKRGKTDDPSLILKIDAVVKSADTRTSLMVRNIPNKYTQKMFLEEIRAGGHGDKIDFFYLPIDFKNKCNRGYAFINFVHPSFIVPFHTQYNAKPWKNFNSDKVCAITYARIQGKAAMIKRFENSALMEKDKEYKPLVFNNGEQEDFPVCSVPAKGASEGNE